MVLPEGASTESTRRAGGRRALLVGASATLLAGALTLGALTRPDPITAEPATTSTTSTTTALDRPVDLENFSVAQIATGEPLAWAKTAEIEGGWPVHLVSHEGRLFVFTSEDVAVDYEPHGSRIYSSAGGSEWLEMTGSIEPEGFIGSVASTPFGLVALEIDSSEGSMSVLTSTDGLSWDRVALESNPNSRYGLSNENIGSTDDFTVIAVSRYVDGTQLLEEGLATSGLDIQLDMVDWDVMWTGDDMVVQLRGPLGLAAMQIPVSDLGLTDEDSDVLRGRFHEEDAVAWASHDGQEWIPSAIDGVTWVGSMTPAPDGSLLLFGYGSTSSTRRTYDGVIWEDTSFALPEDVRAWRGGYVSSSASGSVGLSYSEDGREWSVTGLGDLFPRGIDWYTRSFATDDDDGLAMWVSGWSRDPSSNAVRRTEPLVVERDGARLTFELENGVIRLDEGPTTKTWHLWEAQPQDDLVVDLVAQTVTFLGADQTPIATFDFEELRDIEREYWDYYSRQDTTFDALAYSADAETWTIEDLDGSFGERAEVFDLEIINGFIFAVVASEPDAYLSAGALEIWTAPLP